MPGVTVNTGAMNLLYPKIRLALMPTLLTYAAFGGLLAGVYGVVHDEVTYSISHEYFTRFKFAQFHYANFGLPPRVLVAEIGFLATWWVGFFAAWFIARLAVPAFPPPAAFRHSLRGFGIVFAVAVAASIVGCLLGACHSADFSAWQDLAARLGIADLPSFVRVAYIHDAGYLGGLLGLIAAIVYIRKLKSADTIRGGAGRVDRQ